MKFISIEKRPTVSTSMKILSPVLAISISFFICAVPITLIGIDPVMAYSALLKGSLGTFSSIIEVFVKTSPLLLAALGITLAYRAQLYNIGGEGQFYIGALFASLIGAAFNSIPSPLSLLLVILAGFIGGALWAIFPALLKVKFNSNIVITTLLMNYIAFLFVMYLLKGPIRDLTRWEPESVAIGLSARMPILIEGTRFHLGILISFLCAIIVYIILFKMPLGYRIRAIGLNPSAAKYGGINVARNILLVMILSGGLLGLAGMDQVSGIHYRLITRLSPGYGYTAIVIALLGKIHPLGVVLAAFLFSILINGVDFMQMWTGAPSALADSLQGTIIILLLISEVLVQYKVKIGG